MLASHGIDSFGPYAGAADRFMNRSDHLSELMTLCKYSCGSGVDGVVRAMECRTAADFCWEARSSAVTH